MSRGPIFIFSQSQCTRFHKYNSIRRKIICTLAGNNNNKIKILAIAPEEYIKIEKTCLENLYKNQELIKSLAHSNANYAQTIDAIEKGCSHATHLFNAMREIHHREPGIALAALLDERVTVEIIADGMHLHPAIVQLIFKVKGADKVILITYAMRAQGMPQGKYELGGQEVIVENNTARLKNGMLAGSVLTMDQALRNMLKYTGCTLQDAILMTATNPAKKINVFDRKGSIAEGKDADLVVLDENYRVRYTLTQLLNKN